MEELLRITELSAGYEGDGKKILKNISLEVSSGKVVGLVGESGCGKTTLLKSVVGKKMHGLCICSGQISYEGRNLLEVSDKDYKKLLGNEIGLIVQDSISSLNPIKKVKRQIADLMKEKKGMDAAEAYKRGSELLKRMHCPDNIMEKYPFQMSGGQRQRVIIAMAFLLEPKLLLADEPTTALDVTVQAEILKEMLKLKDEYGTGILLISHNMGVVSQVADEIGVMYRGELVEYGAAAEVLTQPKHPYTQDLIRCIPDLNCSRTEPLYRIPEESRVSIPEEGECCFAGRCSKCQKVCRNKNPEKVRVNGGWAVCHLLSSST